VTKALAESLPQDDPEGAVSPDERDAAVLIERAAADGMEYCVGPKLCGSQFCVVIAAAKERQAAA
jgi:hypothetical protein